MRILISGYHNPHYLTVTEYIEDAARSVGHEVISFDDRSHLFPGRMRKRIGILQTLSLSVINRKLVRLASCVAPDIVLIVGGHRIHPSALRTLARLNNRLALWTTDAPRPSDIMFGTGSFYHHLFCQGTEYRDIFHRMGLVHAEWLPMGCAPNIHRRVEMSPGERQQLGGCVAFVGSYYPCRVNPLEKALRYGLTIWGPGWEALPPVSPLSACVRDTHTPPDIWAKIYSASKIVLSLHYRDEQGRFPLHQASPRVFEAMACGAFVLTDPQKDVLSLFTDGRHLVAFSDNQDLDRKIVYYLEHADERERIAAAGRQEVLRNHTYELRIQRLLNCIDQGTQAHPHCHPGPHLPPAGEVTA